MSEVFPAVDFANHASKVAVKLFKRGEIEDDILRETYDREIRALKELKHSSIVELLDSGIDRDSNSLFLVLEWMDTDLSATGKVPISAGWDSYYQEFGSLIFQAFAFAHSRQVIHRDIKPQEQVSSPLTNRQSVKSQDLLIGDTICVANPVARS